MEESIYRFSEPLQFPFEKKKLLAIVKQNQYGDAEAQTLKGISQAIKIQFESDVEVLIMASEGKINLGTGLDQFDHVVYFGVNPSHTGLQLDAKLYKIFKFEGPDLLVAHPLHEIAADKNKKLYLWKCLQMMFNIP